MTFWHSSEFWSACAFLALLLFSLRPLHRALHRWGCRQADAVRARQRAARDVLRQAVTLCRQYEAAYRHRQTERLDLLAAADSEIAFLEADTRRQTTDLLRRHRQEIDLRLRMIADNGRRDMQTRLLTTLMTKTRERLATTPRPTNSKDVLQRAFAALDMYAPALKK